MTNAAPKLKIAKGCKVCAHPERIRIEALQIAGTSLDTLAERFELSRDSIWRHCRNHVSEEKRASYIAGPARIAELAEVAAEENRGLIEYLSILRSLLFGQLDTLATEGNAYGVALLSGRVLEVLREIGKTTGEINTLAGSTVINVTNNHMTILNSAPFADLQAGLLKICGRHPDIRGDVVTLFRELDKKYSPVSETPLLEVAHA